MSKQQPIDERAAAEQLKRDLAEFWTPGTGHLPECELAAYGWCNCEYKRKQQERRK